jgi:hypothetical protein
MFRYLFSSSLIAAVLGNALSQPAIASAAAVTDPVPRNVIYSANLYTSEPNATSNGTQLSILPLIQNPTKITHVILFTFDIKANGTVTFGGPPLDTGYADFIWPQVKQVQQAGVKVMGCLGGATGTVWQRLEQNVGVKSIYRS